MKGLKSAILAKHFSALLEVARRLRDDLLLIFFTEDLKANYKHNK